MAPTQRLAPLDYEDVEQTSPFSLVTSDRPDEEWFYDARLENVADYCTGGHHAVFIGDHLHYGRYRVIHKLGIGDTANVWLCRDMESKTPEYCAVKILMARFSNEDFRELYGIEIIRSTLGESEARKSHICLPLRQFRFEGPNGWHDCLVLPVLGPSVKSLHLRKGGDQLRRKIAVQAMQAMAALHGKGICHGDFRPENILLHISCLDGLSEKQVLRRFGKPRHVKLYAWDGNEAITPFERGHPKSLIYPVDWISIAAEFVQDDACIIDLAQTFPISNPPTNIGLPSTYRSPELLMNGIVGIGTDLWALAATILEIRVGDNLFHTRRGGKSEALCAIVMILGILPEPWWTDWDFRKSYFEDNADDNGRAIFKGKSGLTIDQWVWYVNHVDVSLDGSLRSIRDALPKQWQVTRLSGEVVRAGMTQTEISLFADLLSGVLKYDHANRCSAEALLQHEWSRMTMGGMWSLEEPAQDATKTDEGARSESSLA